MSFLVRPDVAVNNMETKIDTLPDHLLSLKIDLKKTHKQKVRELSAQKQYVGPARLDHYSICGRPGHEAKQCSVNPNRNN